MPKRTHKDLGQVARTVYLPGVILNVYPESPDTDEEIWDTADVEYYPDISPGGATWMKAPIFYHCDTYVQERENGSLTDAARGFTRGDKVMLLCALPPAGVKVEDEEGNEMQFSHVLVIGHWDGPKKCEYNYALIRCGLQDLEPLDGPFGEWYQDPDIDHWWYERSDPESFQDEYCLVFDLITRKLANIPDLEVCRNAADPDDYEYLEFPVTVNKLKPWLDQAHFRGEELFIRSIQGDDKIKWAKAEDVNWLEDGSGHHVMDADTSSLADHFMPYEFELDPVEKPFHNLRSALQGEGDGVFTGQWDNVQKIFDENHDYFVELAGRSKAFSIKQNNGILIQGMDKGDDGKGWDPAEENMPNEVALEISRLETQTNQIEEAIQEQDRLITQYELDIMRYEAKIPELEAEKAEVEAALEDAQELVEALENAGWHQYAIEAQGQVDLLQAEINNLESQIASYQQAIPDTQKLIEEAEQKKDELRGQIETIEEMIEALQNGENPYANTAAVGTDGKSLAGSSVAVRTAYGENEIWTCGQNTWEGMVVSYCDEKWKFARYGDLFPVIPIHVTEPGYWGVAGAWGSKGNEAKLMADVSLSMAAATTKAPLEGNNIFVTAVLKRLNEGYFHRTTWPAVSGGFLEEWADELPLDWNTVPQSVAAKSTQIPDDDSEEPQYMTAINTRLEKTHVWHRWDNWMNTFKLLYATEQMADLTWWFESNAQEWGMTQLLWDTPIGSMFLVPPDFVAGLWLMFGIDVGGATFTCRKDWPLNLKTHQITKHSRKTILQIYAVQRQGITLWNKGDNNFSIQQAYHGPYEGFVNTQWDDESEDPHPVSYADGEAFFELDEADQTEHLDQLYVMRKPQQGEDESDEDYDLYAHYRGAFQQSRHEFEVHAAMDLYNDLYAEHDRRCPTDQERFPELEEAICDLVEFALTVPDEEDGPEKEMPKQWAPVYLDAELV